MFQTLEMDNRIIEGLKKEQITEPTLVQKELALHWKNGENFFVQSETGSGKTLAYLLPMYMDLLKGESGTSFVVLVPTHELAMQVYKQVGRLSKNSQLEIQAVTIVGNVNISRQVEALKKKPQIIIGTPGRVLELMQKRKIPAHLVKTIVVDEADRLIEKNNLDTVKAVMKCCMRDTGLVLCSASCPKEFENRLELLGKDVRIYKLSSEQKIPATISHFYLTVNFRERIETLRKAAKSLNPKKALIFANTRYDVEETLQKLEYHHYSVAAIHGRSSKEERKKAVEDFEKGKIQFLIASDVAARGLHFQGVETVFHLDIPEEPEVYLHRAGRCGRNGEKGLSVLLVTKEQHPLLTKYRKAFGIQLLEKHLYQGKMVQGPEKKKGQNKPVHQGKTKSQKTMKKVVDKRKKR